MRPPAPVDRGAPAPAAVRGAGYAIAALTAMNLLNYIDRYVPSAVKDLFKRDLGLSDVQTSLPLTAFVVVYMVASPFFGTAADRRTRKVLIAAGVALWSVATAAAAFATGFWTFLGARSLVGVGEAAYATISPSLISDFYPPERRNRMLTIFYIAIPVGSALGFVLGGMLGTAWGWRAAFLVCGLPGLVAAGSALKIREPPRGALDTAASHGMPTWPEALRLLRLTKPYVVAVAGYVAVTWAGGGMADWFPTYLERYRGMNLAEAGQLTGLATVAGGLGGTVFGGFFGDWLRGRTRAPYFALSCVTMIPAVAFALVAILATSTPAIGLGIFLAQFFLWCYNGPINAIIVNSVAASMRARAVSVSIFSIHILGDAISPPIIGAISDATGSLRQGVLLIPVFMALGAAIWGYGWRRVASLDPPV